MTRAQLYSALSLRDLTVKRLERVRLRLIDENRRLRRRIKTMVEAINAPEWTHRDFDLTQ